MSKPPAQPAPDYKPARTPPLLHYPDYMLDLCSAADEMMSRSKMCIDKQMVGDDENVNDDDVLRRVIENDSLGQNANN